MYKKAIALILIGVAILSSYAITELNYNIQKQDTGIYVQIPSIGVNESVNNESIDKGVYYDRGVLFGHRTLHGSPFYNLDKVVVGDTIIYNNKVYIVTKVHIEPSDYILVPEDGSIYLSTCTPIGVNDHRIIVEAK